MNYYKQPYSRSKRQGGFSETLKNVRLNVFEDFSAFRTYFFVFVIGYSIFAFYHLIQGNVHGTLAGSCVVASCLVSVWLWCSKKVRGLPLFPVFIFTFLYTYGLQFVINPDQQDTRDYYHITTGDIWKAALTVAFFVLVSTWVWYLQMRKQVTTISKKYYVLQTSVSDKIFVSLFVVCAVTMVAVASEKIYTLGAFATPIRAISTSLGSVAAFFLSYRWGEKELIKPFKIIYFTALMIYMTATAASLLLIGALTMSLIAFLGFVLGRKKIPWGILIVFVPIFYILHAGKGEMRVKYWEQEQSIGTIGFMEYPAYFKEWFNFGWDEIVNKKEDELNEEEKANLLERSNLIGILLSAQKASPDRVSFLYGKTYWIIPELLVPRFLHPNKPWTNEGTSLLNIHYHIQTREMTKHTTIGWGLLNESYANFGYWGVLGLAIVLAFFYSIITQFTIQAPFLSFQGLLGILTMGFAFQSESTAGVLLSAYVQALAGLFLLRFTLMGPVQVGNANARNSKNENLESSTRIPYTKRK